MTAEEIHSLLAEGTFPHECRHPDLVETHISWVIVCDEYVYKIKKPVHYAFLDFSTPGKRRYYCQREVALNRRLTTGMYLDVVPVGKTPGGWVIGDTTVEPADHAVRMRKMDRSRQMDILLANGAVSEPDVSRVAAQVAAFHQKASVLYDVEVAAIQDRFNAIAEECSHLEPDSRDLIKRAVEKSDVFLAANKPLLTERLRAGFFRDGHGDLHLRNIFLLPEPVIFDCIEFNDAYRRIDVLDEVAFLCMDLDAAGRDDLSALFIRHYNELFTAIRHEPERHLFTYYKCYRANVRAKVNGLRAKDADETKRNRALNETARYLRLMARYMETLP